MITVTKRTDLLKSADSYLSREGIDNSLQEAESLLGSVLNCPRIELYLNNFAVNKECLQQYWDLLHTRANGLPLQYVMGFTEFMGLRFRVCRRVFIPRPETEILVETVLKLSERSPCPSDKILDLGTGCGNIAISLAKFRKNQGVFASDICSSALQLAKQNAALNRVNISLVKSNLFSGFQNRSKFSLIASNPPYINTRLIPDLARELHFEPPHAYDGGGDGLFFYRRIVNQAPDHLLDGGWLILEIGDGQIGAVRTLLRQEGKFARISAVKDYNGIERVVFAQKIKSDG